MICNHASVYLNHLSFLLEYKCYRDPAPSTLQDTLLLLKEEVFK